MRANEKRHSRYGTRLESPADSSGWNRTSFEPGMGRQRYLTSPLR